MFFRAVIILIFFFNIFTRVWAKDYIDSLETKLVLVDNEQKLLILDELIPYYFRNEPLQANKKAKKMLDYAIEENDLVYKIRAQRYLGISNSYLTSAHENALNECERIEMEAKSNGFIKELILTKLAIADIYHQIGDNPKSLEHQIEAYLLADSAEIPDLLSISLNQQAKTYIELDDFDKAEQCLKKSLKNAKINDHLEEMAETNIIFGDLYEKRFNHDLAMEHFRRAHEIYLKLRKDIQIAIALYKIGNCYFSMDQRDLAFQYHLNALAIRNRIKDGTGQAESYNKIGLLCIENGEYQRAINNLKLGLNNAEIINSNVLMQQSFDYLYQAYLALNDFENAVTYQYKYIGISELIFSESNERKIKELENKNEIEKREQRIKSLQEIKEKTEKQLASRDRFIITLILLLVVLGVFVLFIVRSYREKRKLNEELQRINDQVTEQNEKLIELNSTKDKFFSIIGHDLKGPLNSLISFSHLLINHTTSLSESEIRTIAKDLDTSLKNLYELLENLLAWARSQTGKIEFKPENFKITEIIKENIQLLSKAALNKKIKIELLADEHIMVYADINSIRTVLRNLLSNAIKFTGREGLITFFVDEWKDCVEIGIRDTGVGITPDVQKKIFDLSAKHSSLGTNKEKGTGLGLILCKEFVEQNNGTISVESKVGVESTFRFTLPKYREQKIKHITEVKAG